MKYSNYTNNTSITSNTCFVLQNGLNTMKVLESKLIEIVKTKYLPIHQDINNQLTELLPSIKCYTNTFPVYGGVTANDKLNLTDDVEISFNHLSGLALYKASTYNITVMSNVIGGHATYKFSISFDNRGTILYYENYSNANVSCGFQYRLNYPVGSGNITKEINFVGIKSFSPAANGDFRLVLTKTVDTKVRFNLKFIIGSTLPNGVYTFYTRVEKL